MGQENVLALPIELKKSIEISVFWAISTASFFAPFAMGHPQWLVGTIVNAGLFLSALFLPKKYWAPVVILPNLAVLARGIMFGPLTHFLIYFSPFIWLGNLILVLVFSKAMNYSGVLKNIGIVYLTSVILGAVAKFGFLFLIANLYFKFGFVPKLFLQSMGIFQLYTAIAGGLISFIIFKSYGKFNTRI